MRLAVFTAQFPGKVNTFFARDMRALIDAGIEIEIFSIYPLNADYWRYVPDILSPDVLPRDRVHHASRRALVSPLMEPRPTKWPRFIGDSAAIMRDSARFGMKVAAKSAYVLPQAWHWAQAFAGRFDHVLAYWGNYAATCAYAFHRLQARPVPFSFFLHAGVDLYRDQAFLAQKALYADNLIVVCDFNRRFLLDLYPAIADQLAPKIVLHHLGLELEVFPFQPEGRQPHTVIGIGRLEARKGFDDVIRAVGERAQRGEPGELVLVGDGEARAALEAQAVTEGIADRVRFTGWLPFDEVCAYMLTASVLVHASPELGDAVPTVIKEAMALGLPVVATTIAGIPELLDDGRCGILVSPRDPVALADGIARMLDDAAARAQYTEAARAFAVRTFDMHRNGAALAVHLRESRRHDEPVQRIKGEE